MTWSRTVTERGASAPRDRSVNDAMTQGRFAVRPARHELREGVERALATEQRVEPRVGEQGERQLEPAAWRPSPASFDRQMSHLRRADAYAPRMERPSKRQLDWSVAVPG